MVEMDVQLPYDIDVNVEKVIRGYCLVDAIFEAWAPGAQPKITLPWSAGGRIKTHDRVIL